ncbi:hypothetical protein [Streptomyces griseorubiginosus]|uniref:hypothetical protein n=1 Tax=Streptomyces griseorubiginosus TaxID=67304 RepID=UPI002E80D042|nr:hypothetical protein [Streptomyces griseorubiginosus]WUB47847.1 hypothetical protein OHN19_32715 [Streptomyces griseorubiginosus]WUB56372.1 hypothetical protein OG942_32725 [Streptomyces griseorubiginosus]
MASAEEASALVQRLSQLSTDLTAAERENLKFLLSMAAGGVLSGHAQKISEGLRESALGTAQHSLPKLLAGAREKFPTGIVFYGRGPFLSDEDLAALDQESRGCRPRAERFLDHYVVSGAPVAREISLSPTIQEFLMENVGSITPTRRANYLYYDEPGLGIDPHVDKDEFSLNILTMLEHRASNQGRSELILHPPDQEAVHLHLKAGESLVFFADSVTHQRTRTVADEEIRLVSFGYRTLGGTHE